MCKSHKILHLCGCFLRNPDIEFCAAALARLNCVVEDVVDLSWCFCPDYPNCEVIIGSDTEHYRSQGRLPPVLAVGRGEGAEGGVRSARVRFRDDHSSVAPASGSGYGGVYDGRGRDTAAGHENGFDSDMAFDEESESEEE